ncbi:MAG: bifunctional folylpolyglutamate synthase/dihydrofolate synthase [Bacteroidales bacterium]|nr:bifunctional folylpolyglutamate synthase/dihydrofolate synthase [Bacteroidales bacterium]
MTYPETIDFLFTQTPVFQREGASAYKSGLDNILRLDNFYGNPHRKFRCIHVGGTNGKGSVSHLTASILQENGYKVGLYTSPHLKDFRERIRVNGNPISEERVIAFTENYIDNIGKEINPSFFELTTELAFTWFAEECIDVAVIEVGLGGRLDSTNIIQPDAAVITNISFDHTALLGNTLEKIAFEKAGIIKEKTPVVIGHAENEVKKVFEETAKALHAPIHWAENEFKIEQNLKPYGSQISVCEDSIMKYRPISCALGGVYQKENAATVLSLMEVLRKIRYSISKESIYQGFNNVIKNTNLRGRWETLSETPRIICDTGHNVAGFQYITAQLAQTPYERLHIVIGMVNDKDINGVLQLLPKDAIYYFTKASIPRALSEKSLAELAGTYDLKGDSYPTVSIAMEAAKRNCRPNDLIFVGGSNYIVAEII